MSITPASTALVQRSAPELEKRGPPHLKACNDSWKVDETYIKVKKVWMYLDRAVDSEGKTLELLLSPTRDAEAAKSFLLKALRSSACSASPDHSIHEAASMPSCAAQPAPRVITVAKNAAYAKAMTELKAAEMLPERVELRQVK